VHDLYKRILWISLSVIFLAAIIFIFVFFSKIDDMVIDTEKAILKNPPSDQVLTDSTVKEVIEEDSEDFYVLMIGLDQRGNSFMLNTDSLIVAHIIPQNHLVKLISIPRDQKVNDPDSPGNFKKINAIFAEGYSHAQKEAKKDPSLLSGKKVTIGKIRVSEEYISSGMVLLRETFEDFMGISIDNTFLVNFETVVGLVDEVGGIEINVDRSMQYTAEFDGTHIDLQRGLQILDGRNALNYARHRLDDRGVNFESSDFDRGRRQQEVISALVKKMSSWGNLTKTLDLLDIVTSNVKTDMSRGTMISLVKDFYGNLSSDTVISVPYPGYWKSPYVHVDPYDLEQTLHTFTSIERVTEAVAGTNDMKPSEIVE
jgi:LCP family protein required for cell wall assembly